MYFQASFGSKGFTFLPSAIPLRIMVDEISITANTKITHLKNNGDIFSFIFNPLDYNIKLCSLDNLKGGSPNENAEIILSILKGEKGFLRDIVVLNAAFGIKLGGNISTIKESIIIAEESIDSGSALKILERLK